MNVSFRKCLEEGRNEGFVRPFKIDFNFDPTVVKVLGHLESMGRPVLVVGGAVRDRLFDNNTESKDVDFEVYGCCFAFLADELKKFGKVDLVGKSFGVIKFTDPLTGDIYDFSVPRLESKSGEGHKGFDMTFDLNITPKQAAARRDFTINSLAYSVQTDELVDFFGGFDDLSNRILRHTSPAFAEDPLRVLRGFQFAGRFGLTAAVETVTLCASLVDQFHLLSKDRVWGEWYKWATRSRDAFLSLGFLEDTGWMVHFPEIGAMKDVPQDPEWHPEGWSFKTLPLCPLTACVTESLQCQGGFGEFLTRSFTDDASCKLFLDALSAVVGGGPKDSNRATAKYAGVFYETLTAVSRPAVVTQTERFMWTFGGKAPIANKRVRVVCKVPLRGMTAVMNGAINDLQVVQRVVEFVSIYVMNMLVPGEFAFKFHFHEDFVETKTADTPGTRSVQVSSGMVMKGGSSPVDFNVVFAFDLDISNVDFHDDTYTKYDNVVFEVNYGDVTTHVKHVVDAATEIADRENLKGDERAILVLSALAHDFAKPETTMLREKHGVMRWTAYGHEEKGGPHARNFLKRMDAPHLLTDKVVLLVMNHMKHINFRDGMGNQAKQVRKLASAMAPTTIAQLSLLMEADSSGRPPLAKGMPETAKRMLEVAKENGVLNAPLTRLVWGNDLLERGMSPGVAVGEWVKKAFTAQENNEFSNREDALAWLDKQLVPKKRRGEF